MLPDWISRVVSTSKLWTKQWKTCVKHFIRIICVRLLKITKRIQPTQWHGKLAHIQQAQARSKIIWSEMLDRCFHLTFQEERSGKSFLCFLAKESNSVVTTFTASWGTMRVCLVKSFWFLSMHKQKTLNLWNKILGSFHKSLAFSLSSALWNSIIFRYILDGTFKSKLPWPLHRQYHLKKLPLPERPKRGESILSERFGSKLATLYARWRKMAASNSVL